MIPPEVIIGPKTTFNDLYTYNICPARLYLKNVNTSGEVVRKYSPPKVNPVELGKHGESIIRDSFKQKVEILAKEFQSKEIEYSTGELERKLASLRSSIENNIKLTLIEIESVFAQSNPLAITAEGTKLKREHGIRAIIDTLNYTTIPHHLTGRLDFVGIREDKSIVIIEVKNKERISGKDRFQLEYYIHGISKGYNYNKFLLHKNEILSQLYPEEYTDSLKLSRKQDIAFNGLGDCYSLAIGLIKEELSDKEKNKLMTIYGVHDIDETIRKFLVSVPLYNELNALINKLEESIGAKKKLTDDMISFLNHITTGDLKEGLLVDTRRSEIEEVELETDFDSLLRGAWQVKNQVYLGTYRAEKVLTACGPCQFRSSCASNIEDSTFESTKSVTSLVHRHMFSIENKNGGSAGEYDWRDLEKVVPIALSSGNWPYRDGLLKKRGWKSLYRDARISKKEGIEFDFWKL